MKRMKQLIALAVVMALCGSQVQAQAYAQVEEGDSVAYQDAGRASYWSAALPIGALVVAAIIIATTNNHHHHHHSGGGGGGGHHSSSKHHHSSSSSSSSYNVHSSSSSL